ncbi:hypothetical protein HBA55_33815 [Pseudomaricurvus alkylphenolicus]|jgi:hypothetical protein|uniref:hypothetical protein n=1 Tax=Pseudomaricurvus alkylphenolicus TaxID=1306991 RepID=UPI0014242586|nr:hypothetical protein [Pseudomaricurvus alkylphenolicus]NIB44610.1 hypothetical protein [Pseudomaricurvus alkylphenolicus]
MSEAQSPKKKFNLNLVQVLDLGCGILNQAFIKQPANKAKALLKELKGGKRVSLGALTLSNKSEAGDVVDSLEVPLSLELDYTEFKGPGFNHPAFDAALRAMLNQIAQTLRAKKDLNILTNQETGGALVHQPGVIRIGEQHNVMVIAIEPGKKEDIILRLMFVDPDQYESLRKDDGESGTEA